MRSKSCCHINQFHNYVATFAVYSTKLFFLKLLDNCVIVPLTFVRNMHAYMQLFEEIKQIQNKIIFSSLTELD